MLFASWVLEGKRVTIGFRAAVVRWPARGCVTPGVGS